MLVGDYDAADTDSPLGPLKDKTESVSVTPVEGFNNCLLVISYYTRYERYEMISLKSIISNFLA